MQHQIGRLVSLAAVGVLAACVAACGAPSKKDNASTTAVAAGGAAASPSPAVSAAPPDKESCSAGTALAQVVGVRVTGARLNYETQRAYAISSVVDALDQTKQAKAKVTAVQVKAIVEEYQAGLDELKGRLEAGSGDKSKVLADIDATAVKFDQASQRLSAMCVELPGAAAGTGTAAGNTAGNTAGGPRAATCAKIDEAGNKLFGPYMEVGAAGNDSVKLKAAVTKLTAALDTFAAELGKLSGETTDSELKAAIAATITDAQKMRQAIGSVGTDAAKLQSVLTSETFNTGQAKLEKVCAG